MLQEIENWTADDFNSAGVQFINEGNIEIALLCFNEALRIYPKFAGAAYNRGNVYRTLGDSNQAISDYTFAIECDPELYEAFIHRGAVYQDVLSDTSRAIADFKQAIKVNRNRFQAHANLAICYLSQPNYAAAIKSLSRAIKIDPLAIRAWIQRGCAYFHSNQFELALADFNRAIALNPTLGEVYLNRGDTCMELGQVELAMADFSLVIALGGSDTSSRVQAHIRRGNILEQMGQIAAAFVEYDQANELEPDIHYLLHRRGWLLFRLGQIPAALESYNRSIEIDGQCSVCYRDRGLIKTYLREHQEAAADQTRALELDPCDVGAYYYRALNYLALQDKRFKKDLKMAYAGYEHLDLKEELERIECIVNQLNLEQDIDVVDFLPNVFADQTN